VISRKGTECCTFLFCTTIYAYLDAWSSFHFAAYGLPMLNFYLVMDTLLFSSRADILLVLGFGLEDQGSKGVGVKVLEHKGVNAINAGG